MEEDENLGICRACGFDIDIGPNGRHLHYCTSEHRIIYQDVNSKDSYVYRKHVKPPVDINDNIF